MNIMIIFNSCSIIAMHRERRVVGYLLKFLHKISSEPATCVICLGRAFSLRFAIVIEEFSSALTYLQNEELAEDFCSRKKLHYISITVVFIG